MLKIVLMILGVIMAEHEWEDKGGGGLDGAEITAARCKACGVWGVQIAEYDSGIVRFISSADSATV